MAVARDDHLEASSFRLQVKLGQIVQHINGDAAEFNDFGFRKLARPLPFINVAADRSHRGKRSKLGKNFGISDITGVNDVLRAAQRFKSLRSKQAMRIGNDADVDKRLSPSPLSFDSRSSAD